MCSSDLGTNVRRLILDTGGRTITVGAVAAGSAIGTTSPVMVGGSDGTNVRRILTDTSGNQTVVGTVAAGSAIGTTSPVMMAGSDGTNVRRVLTDTAGNVSTTTPVGRTAGNGLTNSGIASGATNNAAFLKASAGMIYQIAAFNNGSSPRYLKFYNKASAPAPGTDNALLVLRIMVPAGGGVQMNNPLGWICSTGIAYAIVAGASDTDNTSIVANEVLLNVSWI